MQKSKLIVTKIKDPLTKHKIRKKITKVNQKLKELRELWRTATDIKQENNLEIKINNTKNRLTELERQNKQLKL